ncbi:hypothetical protein AG1IA_06155 [Rhizoctonia solani AG-1 IA]|uniref:Mediator of RNA polymerase II transcription subunit 13 n=1 Tax=Thanatephorus cucumeris (strain AG1-IA) TaxID=983506 RepID=L8WPC6_THACA|nr:hypothetical protein AG1IA_06155 [Rhizoctonia solani AG-1 IA]
MFLPTRRVWTAGGASAGGAAASGAASDTPQGGQLQLITPVAQDQLMDVDLDLGIDLGLEMEVESATNDKDKDKEKEEETENENVKEKEATPVLDVPYFPLTPPQEDDTGGAWDPLKFGEKYQNVDDKYRGTQGKFGVRGGLTVPPSRPRARTFNQGRIEEGTARESWALSFCATPTSVLAKRIELGLGLRPRSSSSLSFQQQPSPQLQLSKSQPNPYVFQARPYPQLQLHHLPQFQLKNQLPTPSPSPNAHRKLRSGYINLTNPSAKRIRTLRLAHSQPVMSTNTARPVFARDWVPIVAPQSPTATVVSSASEDSDSSADDDDDEFIPGTAPRSAAPSRGTTPPTSAHPNGLLSSPPGPALLVAMFRPNALGSGMLGDVLTWTSQDSKEKPVVPVSVPTPVSPGEAAVAVGTVEAGVNVLAREAVDNWAWGADQVIQADTPTPATQPSRNELMLLGSCLSALALAPGSETMTLSKLTAVPKLDLPLPAIMTDRAYLVSPRLDKPRVPKVAVGHSGQVVQVYAPALRFWEVVGLEPVGGAKDVVAYAVVEEGEEVGVVKRWMERVGQVYETRRLGKHVVGDVGGGVVSVKWESMVKTLGEYSIRVLRGIANSVVVSFISSLPLTQSHIILYLIIPQRAFSSPALRSFIPTLESNKFISTLSEHRHRLSTHLVPASLLFDHSTTPPESRQRLVSTALSVYDRIPRTVGRRIRREIISLDIPAHTSVHVPAYTLARPLAPRFRFSMDWPDAQREVFDRHMFLHVGYSYSKSKRWLGATCIDERGEAYETKVWMCEEWSVGKVIAKVWSFAMRFAKRAAIEWRIVFCKMGEMEWDEVQAWEAHTSAKMSGDTRLGMHVSVLRFDLVTGLALSTSASPSVKAPVAPAGTPPSTVVDLTANDYLVLPGYDTEVCTIPDLDSPVSDSTPSVLPLATAHYFRLTDPPITRPMGRLTEIPSKTDDPPVGLLSSQLHLLHFNLTQNSSLWKSGGDPWRELLQSFYALTTLTQTRSIPPRVCHERDPGRVQGRTEITPETMLIEITHLGMVDCARDGLLSVYSLGRSRSEQDRQGDPDAVLGLWQFVEDRGARFLDPCLTDFLIMSVDLSATLIVYIFLACFDVVSERERDVVCFVLDLLSSYLTQRQDVMARELPMTQNVVLLAQIYAHELCIMAAYYRRESEGFSWSNQSDPGTLLNTVLLPLIQNLTHDQHQNIIYTLEEAEMILAYPLDMLDELITSWKSSKRNRELAMRLNRTAPSPNQKRSSGNTPRSECRKEMELLSSSNSQRPSPRTKSRTFRLTLPNLAIGTRINSFSSRDQKPFEKELQELVEYGPDVDCLCHTGHLCFIHAEGHPCDYEPKPKFPNSRELKRPESIFSDFQWAPPNQNGTSDRMSSVSMHMFRLTHSLRASGEDVKATVNGNAHVYSSPAFASSRVLSAGHLFENKHGNTDCQTCAGRLGHGGAQPPGHYIKPIGEQGEATNSLRPFTGKNIVVFCDGTGQDGLISSLSQEEKNDTQAQLEKIPKPKKKPFLDVAVTNTHRPGRSTMYASRSYSIKVVLGLATIFKVTPILGMITRRHAEQLPVSSLRVRIRLMVTELPWMA